MVGAFFFLATCVATACIIACNGRQASQAARADNSASSPSAYPLAVEFNRVGKYPSETKSGAGYFYDDVLEYRVWFYVEATIGTPHLHNMSRLWLFPGLLLTRKNRWCSFASVNGSMSHTPVTMSPKAVSA
jgi:hypothetical protein